MQNSRLDDDAPRFLFFTVRTGNSRQTQSANQSGKSDTLKHQRHNNHAKCQENDAVALRERGLTFCAVSAPRLPETFPSGQPVAYFRLHGKSQWYRHDYTPAELAEWRDRILASGAREAWVYFDNDRNGYAVKNALQLRRAVRDRAAEAGTRETLVESLK